MAGSASCRQSGPAFETSCNADKMKIPAKLSAM
jgi:hypothetical protein